MSDKLKKVEHYTHLEELALEPGGIQTAIENVSGILQELTQGSGGKFAVQVKGEGAPGFVAGIDPSDKKFFVGYKKALQTGRIFKSIDDVKKEYANAPHQIAVFGELFNELKSVIKNGIYAGDVLFASFVSKKKKLEKIAGVDYLTFMPNTLKFSIPVDNKSELYQTVRNAKLGVMIHTKFKGTDLKSLSASFDVNTSKDPNIANTKSVFIMDARPENVTDKITLDKKIAYTIESKLRVLSTLSRKLGPDDYVRVKALLKEIEPHINSRIRAGADRLDVSRSFISSLLSRSKAKLKSEKAQKERDEIVSNNLNTLKTIILCYKLLFQIKMDIVNAINSVKKKIQTFAELKQNNVFEPTNPEGYLIVNLKAKSIIKLVDRFTFSRINFRRHE